MIRRIVRKGMQSTAIVAISLVLLACHHDQPVDFRQPLPEGMVAL